MPPDTHIPFNRPALVGMEHHYIDLALASGKLSGNGMFAQRCASLLEQWLGAKRSLITPSCTAALEMAGLLVGLEPGAEIIVPDFAFVSCANAFALHRATPVFVDIDPRTLNISPDAIAAAVSDRTRAIVVVHYAGIACHMDDIMEIADRHKLIVIEDAAHALGSSYRKRPLGGIGDIATLSFHETKNIQCGEGGALVLHDQALIERAEVIQEKGTDRGRFFRGEVDKYTWRDIGSSYLLSEVGSAFLWAQLEKADAITSERRAVWNHYYEALEKLEADGLLRRPIVPPECMHNGHLFYVLLASADLRDAALQRMKEAGVHAVFHYLPLHLTPGGRRFGVPGGPIWVSIDVSERLLRLPLWCGIGMENADRVIEVLASTLEASRGARCQARA
jgi:dTDP-4-amino-4,6-dideoxygalactose transaminase